MTSWRSRLATWVLDKADEAATRIDPPDDDALWTSAWRLGCAAVLGHLYLRTASAEATGAAHARAIAALRSMVTSQGERLGALAEEVRRAREEARVQVSNAYLDGLRVAREAAAAQHPTAPDPIVLAGAPQRRVSVLGHQVDVVHEVDERDRVLRWPVPAEAPRYYRLAEVPGHALDPTWAGPVRADRIEAAWPHAADKTSAVNDPRIEEVLRDLAQRRQGKVASINVDDQRIRVTSLDATEFGMKSPNRAGFFRTEAWDIITSLGPAIERDLHDAYEAGRTSGRAKTSTSSKPTPPALEEGQVRASLDGDVVRVEASDGRLVLRPIACRRRPFPVEVHDLAAAYPIVLAGLGPTTSDAAVARLATYLREAGEAARIDEAPRDHDHVVSVAIQHIEAWAIPRELVFVGQQRVNRRGAVVTIETKQADRCVVSCLPFPGVPLQPLTMTVDEIERDFPIVLGAGRAQVAIVAPEEATAMPEPVMLGQQRVSATGEVVAVEARRADEDAYYLRPVVPPTPQGRVLDEAGVRRAYPIVLRSPVAPVLPPSH